jgi:membrane-bound serine protease (ClpP class)
VVLSTAATLALAAWAPLAASQEAEAPAAPFAPARAAHLRIEGQLDAGTRSHLRRAIAAARELAGGARAHLVIELDTPGGEVELMWELAGQLDEAAKSGVEVSGWVHDRAYSAGALIALACDPLYMAPQGAIGAAAPVALGPQGLGAIPDETMRAKVTSALRSSFRGWAEAHGRPPALAEAMVDSEVGVREVRVDGVARLMTQTEYDDARLRGEPLELVRTIVPQGELLSLSGSQAVELQLADGLASSLGEVLDKIGAGSAEALSVPRSRSDELAGALDSIKYLLLIAGLLAAWTEIKAPGFGLPGIVAIACIGLFLFGRYLVGIADVIHIVAVGLGIVLIAAEIFLAPGTLWMGLAGGALLIGGLVASTIVPAGGLGFPMARALAIDEAFRFSMGLLVAVVGAWGLSRVLPRAPGFSRMVLAADGPKLSGTALVEARTVAEKRSGLLGSVGVALTDLRPVGKVRLDTLSGEDFEARVEGAALDRGARVRVVDVSSGRLVVAGVEPAPDVPSATGSGGAA